MATPAPDAAKRRRSTQRDGERQAHFSDRASTDQVLVVTSVQLITPVSGQARRDGSLGGVRVRSAPQIHQLDPHTVGVGAVDELEWSASEVNGRPARLDQLRGGGGHIAHPE